MSGSRFVRVAYLSGGGARGAFQVGALSALTDCGVTFDGYVGASTGAIQAAFMSTGDGSLASQRERVWSLWRAWLSLRGRRSVYRVKRLAVLKWLFSGAAHPVTVEPFVKLVGRFIDRDPILPVRVVCIDLWDGASAILSPTTRAGLVEAVTGSATLPLLAEPVSSRYVDGGLCGNRPLKAAVELLNEVAAKRGDHIGSVLYVITTSGPPVRQAIDWSKSRSADILDRLTAVGSWETFHDEVDRVRRETRVVWIHPRPADRIPGVMDFHRHRLSDACIAGQRTVFAQSAMLM